MTINDPFLLIIVSVESMLLVKFHYDHQSIPSSSSFYNIPSVDPFNYGTEVFQSPSFRKLDQI